MPVNFHQLLHAFPECTDWGPPRSRWLFPYERINHFYVQRARNSNKNRLFQSFIRHTAKRILRYGLTLSARSAALCCPSSLAKRSVLDRASTTVDVIVVLNRVQYGRIQVIGEQIKVQLADHPPLFCCPVSKLSYLGGSMKHIR
jgi:hypothetical protein